MIKMDMVVGKEMSMTAVTKTDLVTETLMITTAKCRLQSTSIFRSLLHASCSKIGFMGIHWLLWHLRCKQEQEGDDYLDFELLYIVYRFQKLSIGYIKCLFSSF